MGIHISFFIQGYGFKKVNLISFYQIFTTECLFCGIRKTAVMRNRVRHRCREEWDKYPD
ncbi:hypothetical protein CLOBOL_01241 [Enterocloster bolteae ATCC BAA-613]|uniref:Uncharacterized protein n=1 Tax=Enterocloster bolteae (strain ATCC BAA-613 / DSM 15670 / CCUG 46953 / JCM 12243 / WAL 16351) TaxID=411902 RepID=A8RK88_ENTBW|nr:hypothetical protein CLOBOL_01241 [Enterocloster bolteae ATCC BAA-613]